MAAEGKDKVLDDLPHVEDRENLLEHDGDRNHRGQQAVDPPAGKKNIGDVLKLDLAGQQAAGNQAVGRRNSGSFRGRGYAAVND